MTKTTRTRRLLGAWLAGWLLTLAPPGAQGQAVAMVTDLGPRQPEQRGGRNAEAAMLANIDAGARRPRVAAGATLVDALPGRRQSEYQFSGPAQVQFRADRPERC